MSDTSTIRDELRQRRPFHSRGAEVAVSIMRTAAVIEHHFGQVLAPYELTVQQYNVLRILRGAGEGGLPTLSIRDRMVHEAPGITRLVDRLVERGLVSRERCSPDRRQVVCRITEAGTTLLAALEPSMAAADDAAVAMLDEREQGELLRLLDAVRAAHPARRAPEA